MQPALVSTRHGYCTVRVASWKNDRQALRLVREAVFIREQGVPVELEWDEHDATCIHLLALDPAGNAIGTARLLPNGSIGRMAVLAAWRKTGIGSFLLRQMLNEAKNCRLTQVSLNAQVHALEFYRRFGFIVTGGKFMDAGIPHVTMSLQMVTA